MTRDEFYMREIAEMQRQVHELQIKIRRYQERIIELEKEMKKVKGLYEPV